MALSQVLWSLGQNKPLDTASLLSERELEDVLQDNISLLNPDWLVIGRQVATPNGKYLDLLCIDRDADLVVVELKRDLTPREVTAQVIEYASYMAEKQPEEIAQIYLSYTQHYLSSSTTLDTAYQNKFGVPLDEESVNQKVKMVIVAAKMDDGTEHIIQYLRQTYNVDINILFFQIFRHGEDRLLSRVWVNIPHTGYVGVGLVSGEMIQASHAVLSVDGEPVPMKSLALKGTYFYEENNPELAEYVVPVRWIKTVPINQAVKETGFFGNQNTVCRPTSGKWQFTIHRLKSLWNIH
ncbi:MAG: endonuclease NucS [Evtepia sp.]|uniref:endonuclease NucS domain-containing protein n=1 Tax=Evtepia sp. TaxID=2773933 RepID=UPI002A7572F3|nr:endonuclease NucS domain-containing protein [Evtepia sp.]MDY3014430.1 endonuclease NucS [Evtepia sp.]